MTASMLLYYGPYRLLATRNSSNVMVRIVW